MAHGSIREWGQWVILDESVEGRWACPGTLGAFLKCLRGHRVSRASQGPQIHWPRWHGWGWLSRRPKERLGHQRSSRQTHCHLLGGWGILRNWAQVTPGGLGGFARPGPLRAVPRPLEHGHLVPGSRWSPLLPLRGDSKPTLVSPLGQDKRLTSPAPLPG